MATEYKKPHFGNLQARAKRLGLIISRMTTDEDARAFGGHEFVLTKADATDDEKDNARLYALAGIARCVEEAEEIADRAESVDECVEAARPVISENVPLTARIPTGDKEFAREALNNLEKAIKASGEYRILAREKSLYRPREFALQSVKDLAARRAKDSVGKVVADVTEVIEVESDVINDTVFGKDTIFRASVIVIPLDQYYAALTALRQIVR